MDTSIDAPQAILERIRELLSAPSPDVALAEAAAATGQEQQRFFGGERKEGAGVAAARRLQGLCEEYGGIPEGVCSSMM